MNSATRTKVRGVALSWMLMSVWLAYSAAMLWDAKLTTFGFGPMCQYTPQK